jgi:hypothetical protein
MTGVLLDLDLTPRYLRSMGESDHGAHWAVTLSDPGMYDRTFSITSWDELAPLLARHVRTYTRAWVTEGRRVIGWASRELGERDWRVRRRAPELGRGYL